MIAVHRRTFFLALVVALTLLCGTAIGRARLVATYTVKLNGSGLFPVGERRGTATVRIRFYGATELCWRILSLEGVPHPYQLAIFRIVDDDGGLRTSAAIPLGQYRTAACLVDPEAAGPARFGAPTTLLVERHPSDFAFGINTHDYDPAVAAKL